MPKTAQEMTDEFIRAAAFENKYIPPPLEFEPQPGDYDFPDGAGMAQSTRCGFCGEFYDKARPSICPDCWEMIVGIVNTELKRRGCDRLMEVPA